MLGINEKQVYKCPACKQFMSSDSDICPKCSFRITEELKQSAINTEIEEVKEEAAKSHRTTLYSGIGLLGAGLLAWFYPNGLVNKIFPELPFALIVTGSVIIFLGLKWLWKEKQNISIT